MPTVDEYYAQKQGVKIVNKDTNIKARLEKPNKISIGIIIIVSLIVIITISLISFFRKRKRRKKSRISY